MIKKILNSRYSILIFILLLAAFFRFYQLNQVPPSPSLDEVSIGWNAYSILETGRDEYGTKLPVLLRAYDDWRPAGYVYLVIPFIKIFGLSAAAVRLPAVILSLITILAVYFLAREVFASQHLSCHLSFITCFLLAISPWHIYLSRLGHEVNAGLTFSILGILFFIKAARRQSIPGAINRRKTNLLLAAVFFALSLYTYQSQKIFAPLLLLSLVLIYRKTLGQMKKNLILVALVGLLLSLPILKASLSPQAAIRFRGTSIFATSDTVWRAYFSHFKPAWLFFNSGREDHKIPGMGVLYFWELPLILIGAYQLAAGKFSRQSKFLILSWILIAPLPASITTGAPHAMRTFNLLPIPQILGALGVVAIARQFKASRKIILLLGFFLLVNWVYLYHNYFIVFPRDQSGSFQYPLGQAIDYVLTKEGDYQKIIFSNQNHGYQSYMFFLFFGRFSPSVYLEQGGTISGGYAETHQIGKYEFRPIRWSEEEKSREILYVGNFDDFPLAIEPLEAFKPFNNQEAIKIVRGDS